MKPLNKHIILKEVLENKTFKGIIIPKQIGKGIQTLIALVQSSTIYFPSNMSLP